MGKRSFILGGLGAILVLIVAAGVGLAQTGDEEPAGISFLDRIAGKLGIESSELEQAVRDARIEEIDAAVERGDLTPEKAERLKARSTEAPFGWEPGSGNPYRDHGGRPGFGLLDSAEALAEFLGIDRTQLREELGAEGATLASVAEAHGKSRDELKTFLQAKADERVDQALAEGRLTQERADTLKSKLAEHLDAFIDRSMPNLRERRALPFENRGRHGPTPGATDSSYRF